LNVREEDFPEEYRPLVRRLKMAASSADVKEEMIDEDGVVNYIKGIERSERSAGRKEGVKEGIREVARNLLKDGVPVETVCKCTGLSFQEIEKLMGY
jgi:predicted transposase/invertase (TIGR01784 family)